MIPPFCPNPSCQFHDRDFAAHSREQFWATAGSYDTLVVGSVVRFTCRACHKGFSERTFSIDYYTKKSLDNKEIFRAISQSESVSSIARHLNCSIDSVLNRLDRLGRNSLAFHSDILSGLSLSEHLVADGFESFDLSQYFPNNINLLVGKESQFLYGFTHTTLRRKGRMTARQRELRAKYDRICRAPRDGIRKSFSSLLSIVPRLWDRSTLPNLVLITDEHPRYPTAIQSVSSLAEPLVKGDLTHETVSSKLPRTTMNPLFSVNYYDRELRKDIAAYRRETTCFGRNVSNGLLRLSIHQAWHNNWKEHRVKMRLRGGMTHAYEAGVRGKEVEVLKERLFVERSFLSHHEITAYMRKTWLKLHASPLKTKPDYVQAFARVGMLQASGD